MPRYFTLEYGKSIFQDNNVWYIGEYYLKDGKRCHNNYGQVNNMRLTFFAGYIFKLLESNNKI